MNNHHQDNPQSGSNRMNKYLTITLTILFIVFSAQALADRENDMWQQFKAQKAMQELDAEFAKPAPEPVVVERVIERVVERPAPQPQPVAVQVPVISPPPVLSPSAVIVESDGFIFSLEACRLAHRNIKCQLSVTSVDNDGELSLYASYGSASSRLFDHNGNEYQPATISMGNKNNGRYVKNRYISGVVAKGRVEFVNVDTSTNSISMFELNIRNTMTGKYNRIKFRDVTLNL